MAIFHLSHKSVGRMTHAAGTAGAHVDYIVRSSACDLVIGEHMDIPKVGSRGGKARRWLNEQEQADRKNARVIDKVTVALPHELTDEQQVDLVRDFAASVTGGQAPYLAAFHRSGKDAENKHGHFVFRDRHIETGKRVWGRSGKGLTEELREKWEAAANAALAKAKADAQIDRRSLLAQGINRDPTRHEGPAARAIQKREGLSEKIERIKKGTARRKQSMDKARRARKAAQVPLDHHEAYNALVGPLRDFHVLHSTKAATAIAVFAHDPMYDIAGIFANHALGVPDITDFRKIRTVLRDNSKKREKILEEIQLHDKLGPPFYDLSMSILDLPDIDKGKPWKNAERILTKYTNERIAKTIIAAVDRLATLIRAEKLIELDKPTPPPQGSGTVSKTPSPQQPAPKVDYGGPSSGP